MGDNRSINLMTITAALNFIMIYSNIYFKNNLLNKLIKFTTKYKYLQKI
jgi:hypothetical protein